MEDLLCWQLKFASCYYSNRLINKIMLLNQGNYEKVDLIQIKKAIFYAKKYHGSQRRLSGEPYYTHPIIVAEMVADFCFKTDILVTSILHDTIEDTKLTKSALQNIFNATIAQQVDDLTRIKNGKKINSADLINLLWKDQKIDLLLVKLFDRLHNIKTIDAKPPEQAYKKIIETIEKFTSLIIYLKTETNYQLELIDQYIMELCYRKCLPFKQQKFLDLNKLYEDSFRLPFLYFHNA